MGLVSAISGFSSQFFLEVSVCDSYSWKLPGLASAAVIGCLLGGIVNDFRLDLESVLVRTTAFGNAVVLCPYSSRKSGS